MADDTILTLRALCLVGLVALPVLTILVHVWRRRSRLHVTWATLPALSVRPRPRAGWLCMAGAVAAVAGSAHLFGSPSRTPEAGLVLLLIGALLFAAATVVRPPILPNWLPDSTVDRRDAAGAALALAGVATVLLLSDRMQREVPPYPVQIGAWALGVALFVAGVTPPGVWRAAWRGLRRSWRAQWREWLFVLALTVVALALRLVKLETSVPAFIGDEAFFARDAAWLLDEGARASVFAPGHEGQPWLLPALQNPFLHVMGRTFTAARVLPAVAGALTVPATYLLARELAGWRIAAVAAAFLAGYPVHMHFSRLALNNIFDPFFGVLAFALLLRGLRGGSRLSFALAGVTLGLSQYWHAGGRLIPVLMAGYLAYLTLTRVRLLRAHWRGLAVLAGTALLVVWPMMHHLYANGLPLVHRAQRTSLLFSREGQQVIQYAQTRGKLGELLANQVKVAALAFVQVPDSFFFYGGETAMLLPLAAGPFLLGVLWALRRWRRPPEALLLAWVGLTALLGGALVTFPPGYARYVVATPAIAIMTALGLVRTLDYLLPPTPASLYGCLPTFLLTRAHHVVRLMLRVTLPILRQPRRAAAWIAAGATALLVITGVDYYFSRHVADFLSAFQPRVAQLEDLRDRIAQLPDNLSVHIISEEIEYIAQAELNYFFDTISIRYHGEQPTTRWDFVDSLRPGGYVFYVSPKQMNDLEALMDLLPGGILTTPPRLPEAGLPYIEYIIWVDHA